MATISASNVCKCLIEAPMVWVRQLICCCDLNILYQQQRYHLQHLTPRLQQFIIIKCSLSDDNICGRWFSFYPGSQRCLTKYKLGIVSSDLLTQVSIKPFHQKYLFVNQPKNI